MAGARVVVVVEIVWEGRKEGEKDAAAGISGSRSIAPQRQATGPVLDGRPGQPATPSVFAGPLWSPTSGGSGGL